MDKEFVCAKCGKRSNNLFDFQFIQGENAIFTDIPDGTSVPYNTGQNYCNECAKKKLSFTSTKLKNE